MLENIDAKTILPLIGVAIGWLLSETGFFLRARREQKKVIGKAILKLLQLREIVASELSRLSVAKEFAESNILSDETRHLIASLRDKRIDDFQNGSDALLDEIATVDPLLSFQVGHDLRTMHNVLVVGKDNYLTNSTNQEFWRGLFIETGEFKYKALMAELKKSILKLAKRKSLQSWFRTWWYFRHEKDDPTNVGKMLKEAYKILKPFDR